MFLFVNWQLQHSLTCGAVVHPVGHRWRCRAREGTCFKQQSLFLTLYLRDLLLLDSAGLAAMLLQGGSSAVLLLLIHLLEPSRVLGFNLDTTHVLRKTGEPDSLFGFSLALHRQVNPDQVM